MNSKLTFVIVFVTVFAVFSPSWIKGTWEPDSAVIEVLKKVDGISSYGELWREGKIFDIQPLRDLSLLVDVKIADWSGWEPFVFHNLLLWVLALFCLFSWSARFVQDDRSRCAALVLFALHPTFAMTLNWPTARKHLLSFLLINLATLFFIRIWNQRRVSIRNMLLPGVFYLASLLSQPVTILWSLWPCWLLWKEERKLSAIVPVIPLLSVMILMGMANWYYYNVVYINLMGNMGMNTSVPFSDVILSFGRYTIQLLLPLWHAFGYDKGDWQNLAGLPLLVMVIALYWKYGRGSGWAQTLPLFFLGLLPITSKQIHFVGDRYVLMGSLAFFPALAHMLSLLKRPKFQMVVAGSLALLFGVKTGMVNSAWATPSTFWKMSYESSPDCTNLVWHAWYRLGEGDNEQGIGLARDVAARKCTLNGPTYRTMVLKLLTVGLVYEDSIAPAQKVQIMEKYAAFLAYSRLALGAVMVESGRIDEGRQLVNEELGRAPELRGSHDPVVEYIQRVYEKNGLSY